MSSGNLERIWWNADYPLCTSDATSANPGFDALPAQAAMGPVGAGRLSLSGRY